MPRQKKPHKFDDGYSLLLGELADCLGKDAEDNVTAVDLATAHLKRHGLIRWDCKLCGVAKAIIDCFVGLEERYGFELCEQVRSMVSEVKARKAKLERTIPALYLERLKKEGESLKRLKHPEEHKDVRVLLRGQRGEDPLPTVGLQEPTLEGIEVKLESILSPLKTALEMCDPLVVALAEAEGRIAEGIALTSLVEPRKRVTKNQIEIKVDCYLTQHGWKVEEIRKAFYNVRPRLRTADSIAGRVGRAKHDGKPTLIWPWPDQVKSKESEALLESLNLVNPPATR
jgi:hypothetical protein